MKRIKKIGVLAVLLTLMTQLCGCVMTAEEMYCLPRRSERYDNLQAVIDPAMKDLEHAAPLSGENQQTVQSADLDGDGVEEVILFAKGNDEHPLKILIFRQENQQYSLLTAIESYGLDFDQVEYVQMDGLPGLEMVVGRQLSDQLLGNVTVYRIHDGQMEQVMNTGYHQFLLCDLDDDDLGELLVLTGNSDTGASIAVRYTVKNGRVERSAEAALSEPVDQLKRIVTGSLHGGQRAVFVASMVDANTLVTDVFALTEGTLTNLSLLCESGTSIKTLRNYYVYAEDIDQDGEIEIPSLITMRSDLLHAGIGGEHLIRWFALTPEGVEKSKLYTYHNYLESWYMVLPGEYADRFCIRRQDSGCYSFGLWDSTGTKLTELWRVYVFTGEDRSALAAADGRFLLMKTDTVAYAASLEADAQALGVTRDNLIDAFRLIQPAWYTGEM